MGHSQRPNVIHSFIHCGQNQKEAISAVTLFFCDKTASRHGGIVKFWNWNLGYPTCLARSPLNSTEWQQNGDWTPSGAKRIHSSQSVRFHCMRNGVETAAERKRLWTRASETRRFYFLRSVCINRGPVYRADCSKQEIKHADCPVNVKIRVGMSKSGCCVRTVALPLQWKPGVSFFKGSRNSTAASSWSLDTN